MSAPWGPSTTRGVEAVLPRTHYAKNGEVHVAYRVLGERPLDLLLVPGWASYVEQPREDRGHAYFLHRLAALARLIVLDKRDPDTPDRVTALPDIEQRMDDVRVVMDAVGSKRAVLFGYSEGGTMCQMFAASHPESTAGLITYGCRAKRIRSENYPPSLDERLRYIERVRETWLGTIRTPTLVINRVDDSAAPIEGARYLANHIPRARLVELPGADHLPWMGRVDEVLNEIEAFLTDLNLSGSANGAGVRALTRRQRTILELIAQGLSNKEIASLLYLSEHTVHRHLANILERLGVATRAAAVARMRSSSLL
jgi:pimeloyl-ACP methyl ester carboxylesterase/DNA-binding CsgD family transcriptional regulator